eukprot:GGOE01015557.1.p1 GENE.GGOE01015557.1~~GGOE01015557.1.p1  ORF type:complete len:791 (+),score=139.70 GGOE01015557.1:104-2476(+)
MTDDPTAPTSAPRRDKTTGNPYRVGEHPLKVAINRYLAATCASLLSDVSAKTAVVLDTPLLLSADSLHAVGFQYDRICIPNPDPGDASGMVERNPAVRVFPCTSHRFIEQCAEHKSASCTAAAPERPLLHFTEFHAAYLDFCGVWGAKRLSAGRKRRHDVEVLFAARLLAPSGSVLGITCAGRGGVLGRYDGALVDHTVLGVQDLARSGGYCAHPLCVVQYHIRSPMYFVAFAVAGLADDARLREWLPTRPVFGQAEQCGRATVRVTEGWDVARPRELRPLQGAEQVIVHYVGWLARLVLAQCIAEDDDPRPPAVLVMDSPDGPTVEALHAEAGVPYHQMVVLTDEDAQQGQRAPLNLFITHSTVALLLASSSEPNAPPPPILPPYAVACLAWPNTLKPAILHDSSKWNDVIAMMQFSALPRDRCGLLIVRFHFGDGHWQDDAVDYIVAGVQRLAGQHNYSLHPVRAFLFSGYSRCCSVVFISTPTPCPDGLGPSHWQSLVAEACTFPKASPPDGVPHWQEAPGWDWRCRTKASVVWHAKKLSVMARYAAMMLATLQPPPDQRRVLVVEKPPFVLWRALCGTGCRPSDLHLVVADDIEAAMAEAHNSEMQFAPLKLAALTCARAAETNAVDVVPPDTNDPVPTYSGALVFLSGPLGDAQPAGRALRRLLRGDALRLSPHGGSPAVLLLHAAAFGVKSGSQGNFLRSTAQWVEAVAAEERCPCCVDSAVWFAGHNPSFCMALTVENGSAVVPDPLAAQWREKRQTLTLGGNWCTLWTPDVDSTQPFYPDPP